MTTFNWTISAVDRELSLDGLTDVIKTVHWRYKGTDVNGVTSETYGATAIGNPNPTNFTPFPQLTDDDVIRWLESIMSVVPPNEVIEGEELHGTELSQLEKMKANIEAQISLIIAPKNIIGPLGEVSHEMI